MSLTEHPIVLTLKKLNLKVTERSKAEVLVENQGNGIMPILFFVTQRFVLDLAGTFTKALRS